MKLESRSGSKTHRRRAGHEASGQAGGGEWQSQEDLAALIDSIPDAIVKSRDGVIVWCNDRVQDVFGYRKEDLLGTDGSALFPRAAEHSEHRDLAHQLTAETGHHRGRTEMTRKDGSLAFVEFLISRIPGKEPLEFVVVVRDITGRVLAERALREANDELEQRVGERTMEIERANNELRRSREYFKSLTENAFDAIVTVSRDGSIGYESSSVSRVLGHDPGDRFGKSPFDFIHPEDVPKAADAFAQLMQNPGVAIHEEVRLRHEDRSWRTVEVVGRNLLDDPAVEGIVANLHDVTGRKEAEEALQRSEERFRALIENSSDGITVIDAAGALKYESPSVARITGYKPGEWIGRNSFEPVHPDDMPAVTDGFHRLLQNPSGIEWLDVRMLHQDGSWRTIEVVARNLLGHPAVAGIVVNMRDTTERKRMETALRESEQSLRALIDNAPEAITAYELDGTILDSNRKGEELLGYCREEMVGKNMFDLGVIPEDHVSKANRALEKGDWDKSARPFEFDLLRKDGSRITVEATTITVERGGRSQIICISRDVTERKQMEQQLQLAGRLAAVGELAAGVAHELNNPLAAVQGFAQYLAERENVDESTRDDLETIYREAQRATRITGNLLSFARKHKPEKGFFSINDIVEHSLELHAYRMRVNSVEVVEDLAPDLPRTMVDYHQMQQVFVNMIANAEQAMAEESGRGRLVVRTEQIAETIRITFTDNGPGMTDDVLKSVFDPFFTTKDVGRGTGLGLSICFGIVQGHGGRLYAESEPGKGAAFVVELPVVAGDALSAESGPTGTAQSAP